MSTFSTSLTPTPSAGKGIPYTWFTQLLDSALALKQGDQALDQIVGAVQTSVATGTQNNFTLNDACATLLWTGSGDVTFTGFTGGRLGRRIRVIHSGTAGKFLRIPNLDAGSSTANKVATPSVIGQYLGKYGVMELEWTGTNWIVTVMTPGIPISMAYSSLYFTASGTGSPTWTMPAGASNVTQFQVVQNGQRMSIALSVASSTIATGGTVTNLNLVIPLSATAAQSANLGGVDIVNNASTFLVGILATSASSTTLGIFRYDRGNLTASVLNNYVSFDVTIPIL